MHNANRSYHVLRPVVLALLVAGVVAGCATPAYEQDYRRLSRTASSIEDYLRKYPTSPYSTELRQQLPQLAEQDRLQRQREEEALAAAVKRGAVAWNSGNYSEALRLATAAVAQGDRRANFVLAIIYWNGQGVEADYERATGHMKESGDTSIANAMQTAVQCAKKNSRSPAMKVSRGALQMVNDGTCVQLGLNPSSISTK